MEIKRSFTRKQRNAILERDDSTPRLRHYSEERGWHTRGYCVDPNLPCNHLEVHHINPRRVGGDADPRNLITLAKCEHVGICPSERIKPGDYTVRSDSLVEGPNRRLRPGKYVTPRRFVVHKDIEVAFANYDGTGNAFQEVFAQREQQVKRGNLPYWNDNHDIEMKETAQERTSMMPGKGIMYPRRRGE